MTTTLPEVWLRGPLADIPPLLQPVAHSLRQAAEEVRDGLQSVDVHTLWATPGSAASAGFHVLHAAGSLDRLFTYARGEALTPAQRDALAREATASKLQLLPSELTRMFADGVERALAQLRSTVEADLLQPRAVGRAALPSTVLGLLFHAAEHTQRHVGQMTTTLKVREGSLPP